MFSSDSLNQMKLKQSSTSEDFLFQQIRKKDFQK